MYAQAYKNSFFEHFMHFFAEPILSPFHLSFSLSHNLFLWRHSYGDTGDDDDDHIYRDHEKQISLRKIGERKKVEKVMALCKVNIIAIIAIIIIILYLGTRI